MNFKTFLEARKGRAQETDVVTAIEWMYDNSRKYLQNGHWLYRGFDAYPKIRIGNPQAGRDRKSRNAYNFYTMWMDNYPTFSHLPKRSKSFVMSTKQKTSEDYGDLYLVVPKDSAKVGAVGKGDIWMINIDGPVDLNDLNAFTYEALEYDPETWVEFEDLAKGTSHEYVKDHLKYKVWWAEQLDRIMEKFGAETLFDVWKDTFPASQFKLLTASNLGSAVGELWTDSECVFIPLGKETDRQERYELLLFSEEFPHLHSLLSEHWDELEEVGDPDKFSDEDTLHARK